MDGPKTSLNFSVISVARVIGYDPEHNAVYIQLASGQSPYLPARMLYRGNADQYRIEQEPLPLIGTWGVVAFPGEDDRFPIWLGAYYSTPQDAVTSSNTLQDSQIKYLSHQSGFYSLLDGTGNYYTRFPEGTDIRINALNLPPPTYRHVVDTNLTSPYGTPQIQVQFPNSERVPNPPANFYVSVNHPSGASLTITPSGMVTVVAGNPQLASITMTPSGVITISAGLPIQSQTSPLIVLDPQVGDIQIIGNNANNIITLDNSGDITIQTAGGTGNINILSAGATTVQASANVVVKATGGNVKIQSTGGNVLLESAAHSGESLDNIVSVYNSHTHSDPQGGNTGTPTPTLS